MNFWSNYPFSRIFLPFVLGVILEIYFPTFQFFHIYFSILFLSFFVAVFLLFKSIQYRHLNGILLVLLFFSFGHNYVGVYTDVNNINHYTNWITPNNKTVSELVVSEPILEKTKSVQVKANFINLIQDSSKHNIRGKTLLYLQKDSASLALSVGDTILSFCKFQSISEAQNPGQFNYKRYLRFHQIFFQAYCDSMSWQLMGKSKSFSALAIADKLRKKMLQILSLSNLDEDEYSVASALILGYKESLDDDLVMAYSSSGAMHVLAVSGLHVGIVYMVLNFLLAFLDKSSKTKYLKALILLFSIWFYAFITGLSPSVMRAAMMFSFMIIGTASKRNTNIFNTLFASAFILLLIDPYLIMQVGFQLSYLAVIGIVYIQPRLYKLLYVKNWLLDKVWAITAVSIAAQIATFPLGLLYFHQFPNYFFVSNLVVIPAATLILGVGILLLVFSKISIVFIPLAYLLKWSIKILNTSVFFIEELPYSLTTGISITVLECWLIYVFIVCVVTYFIYKRKYLLFSSLFSLLIILGFDLKEDIGLQAQQKIIVYNIKNKTAIDFIDGSKHYFLTDTSVMNDNSLLLFNVKHNWDDLDLDKEQFVDLSQEVFSSDVFHKRGNFLQIYNKKIVVIDQDFVARKLDQKLSIDILIITQNTSIKPEHLLNMFEAKTLVIDGSCKSSIVKKITAYAKEKNIDCYSTETSGAFQKNI